MKREKFLWPLSQSHQPALVAARRVKEQLSSGAPDGEAERLEKISADMKKLYEEELRQHFWDEERILGLFEARMGKAEPEPVRIRKEHRLLEFLLFQNTKESLLQFAEILTQHIRWEEDVLFGRIEKVFNDAENKAAGEYLQHPSTST